ncbi:DUF1127 domain-containing protein [Hwanghaeella grinnelliae]|uniref:DUF1127 domain-containing protein n=2 Tax=Hwanghaeella grinnelliae TaxID=2500179 RepID=A0A3S2ZB80_9PROT|nr:DUF1127 domain-containing protein [Hwanghaeella grinnelliae]
MRFRPLKCIRHWWQKSSSRIALAQLPDERLADIGLTRAERDREVARPFWD